MFKLSDKISNKIKCSARALGESKSMTSMKPDFGIYIRNELYVVHQSHE